MNRVFGLLWREREGDGKIQFGAPEPRTMAGRPVDWMAVIIDEGAAVPVVVTIWEGMEKEVEWTPINFGKEGVS